MPRKLKAAEGTTEVNIGETDIVVPPDGIIEVPDDQVDALIERGGFSEVEDPTPAPDGNVKMKGPAGASCTVFGQTYTAGDDGLITGPVAAVTALLDHNFAVA